MKVRLFVTPLLLALAFGFPNAVNAQSNPQAPASAAPSDSSDASVQTLAQNVFHQAQAGSFDRSLLSQTMSSQLTDDLSAKLKTALAPLGDPTSWTLLGKKTDSGLTTYLYRLSFKDGNLDEKIVLDANGEIDGLWFTPE
jgi:hypothetical protein